MLPQSTNPDPNTKAHGMCKRGNSLTYVMTYLRNGMERNTRQMMVVVACVSTVRDSINPPNAHVIRKRAQFKFGLVYLFQIWSIGVQVYLLQRASLI